MRLLTDERARSGSARRCPLSLRGGADLRSVFARPAQGHASPASAPTSPTSPATSRCSPPSTPSSTRSPAGGCRRPRRRRSRWRSSTSPARPPGGPCGRCSAPTRRRPSAATRPWSAVRRRRSPPTPSAGPRAASTPSSSSSARATTSRMVRAVRERLGPDARIRVDANGAWSVDEALGVLRMIEPLGIELVEQPVAERGGDGEAHRRSLTLLIAADETVARGKDAERARRAPGLRPGDGEAGEGRRHRGGERGRQGACRSTSRAPSTARWGSPPPRTRRRRCRSRAPPRGSRTGSRPSCCSRASIATRECCARGRAARAARRARARRRDRRGGAARRTGDLSRSRAPSVPRRG